MLHVLCYMGDAVDKFVWRWYWIRRTIKGRQTQTKIEYWGTTIVKIGDNRCTFSSNKKRLYFNAVVFCLKNISKCGRTFLRRCPMIQRRGMQVLWGDSFNPWFAELIEDPYAVLDSPKVGAKNILRGRKKTSVLVVNLFIRTRQHTTATA